MWLRNENDNLYLDKVRNYIDSSASGLYPAKNAGPIKKRVPLTEGISKILYTIKYISNKGLSGGLTVLLLTLRI